MSGTRARNRFVNRFAHLAVVTTALGALLLAMPAASAQETHGRFHFLKTWFEKQVFGKDSAPAAEPPTGALPDSGTAAGVVPEPGDDKQTTAAAPSEPPPEAAVPPDTSPFGAVDEPTLRGSAAPQDGGGVAEPLPPEDATLDAPDSAAPLTPPQTQQKMLPPLRFALLAGRNGADTMATVGPIADDLSKLLDRPVEFLPLPTYGALVDAQVDRRIDGGFYSSAAFALADSRCTCLEPLVAPRAWDGTLSYHAIIVARANAGIRAIADLTGKTVAVGPEDSIGARRMQLAGLMAEGFDPAKTFGAVIEVPSADDAVRMVAAGGADAAFAWSSLAGQAEAGYSRGTLTDLVASGAIAMPTLAVVWTSPAIEHGPFALVRTLAEADKAKIGAYLVALMSANPAAYDALNPFYGGGYAPVASKDYAGLEALVAEDVDALAMPKAQAGLAPTPAAGAGAPVPAEAPQAN